MIYQNLLDRCPHISTVNMENDAWLEKRRDGIGGSDAGAIMGMSGYGSPLTVYLQKKNLVPRGETSRAAHRGKILEPMIRMETTKDFPGLQIEPVPAMFSDPDNPYMIANLDGAIFAETPIEIRGQTIEGLGGHEIKSAKTNYGWGEDEIPDSYYCQVQHYMKVLGLPWFVVSVYILDDETLNHYVIRRNDEFITRLVEAEKDFWENYIQKDIMPAAVGIENEEDMITSMFDGGSSLVLGEEEQELCRQYVEAHAKFNEAKEKKEVISVMIKEILVQKQSKNGERRISATAGIFNISWSRFLRHDVDTEALKRDGLYDKYAKVSDSGQMRITKKKGA
jgi:putative phage-type endonuclease